MMNFGKNTNEPQPQSVSAVEPAKRPEASKPVQSVVKEDSDPGLVKLIVIVILSVSTAAFAGLFAWKYFDWVDASTELQAQIDEAVYEAVLANETKMEAEFAEREKEPNTTFLGPTDYGSLTFSYPKTWSLYVGADASKGGEFNAYMNPLEVPTTNGNDSIMALRVSIKSQAFDSITKSYENYVKNGKMTMSVVNVNNGTATANIYKGELSNPNKAIGIVAIMKIRDKTAIIQTDSLLFEEDFNRVLNTLSFNS